MGKSDADRGREWREKVEADLRILNEIGAEADRIGQVDTDPLCAYLKGLRENLTDQLGKAVALELHL